MRRVLHFKYTNNHCRILLERLVFGLVEVGGQELVEFGLGDEAGEIEVPAVGALLDVVELLGLLEEEKDVTMET
jgi:hypothetical protein